MPVPTVMKLVMYIIPLEAISAMYFIEVTWKSRGEEECSGYRLAGFDINSIQPYSSTNIVNLIPYGS